MELEYHYNGTVWAFVWDQNKVIDIAEWSMCGGSRLERLTAYAANFHLLEEHVLPLTASGEYDDGLYLIDTW